MQDNKFKRNKYINLFSLGGFIVAIWCCKLMAHNGTTNTFKPELPRTKSATVRKFSLEPSNDQNEIDHDSFSINEFAISGLNPKVFKLALKAYKNAKKLGHGSKDILTVVDYSLASTEKRLWVIDLRAQKVLFHTHVAHGSGSGQNYATKFSNRPGSAMSSIGLFVTGKIYHGHYGYSLNMHGLEEKFNSNAYNRRIVMHPAHYVDENIIPKIGRLGRSLGCLALNKKIANNIMHSIKDGSFIFCYYPDQNWIKQSKFFN